MWCDFALGILAVSFAQGGAERCFYILFCFSGGVTRGRPHPLSAFFVRPTFALHSDTGEDVRCELQVQYVAAVSGPLRQNPLSCLESQEKTKMFGSSRPLHDPRPQIGPHNCCLAHIQWIWFRLSATCTSCRCQTHPVLVKATCAHSRR